MSAFDPFAIFAAKRERAVAAAIDAECAKGIRSSNATIVAMHLALMGYCMFPSRVRTKKPRTAGWREGASNDPNKIVLWHHAFKGPDFIIPTGRERGVWIIDVDGARGRARLAELEAKHGPLPKTPSVISGRAEGGAHYWFRPTADGPELKSVGKALIDGKRDCIDQKGRGGYAVIPGSLHASGRRYQWAEGCAPNECELANLPDAWLSILDWADEIGAAPLPQKGKPSAQRGSTVRRAHDPASYLIGDDPGFGGFQNPIFKNAIRYFLNAGVDAPDEPIIADLQRMIVAAPKDHGRDVSRYLSGPDLPRLVERARNFVKEKVNEES